MTAKALAPSKRFSIAASPPFRLRFCLRFCLHFLPLFFTRCFLTRLGCLLLLGCPLYAFYPKNGCTLWLRCCGSRERGGRPRRHAAVPGDQPHLGQVGGRRPGVRAWRV
jgi:hypothetical protein